MVCQLFNRAARLMGLYLLVLSTMYLPVSVNAASADNDWLQWLRMQIVQHPEIVAGRQRLEATLSQAVSRAQPLYNPQLETEFEREGDDSNYQFGLSQTIDWQGKRDLGGEVSQLIEAQAQQAFELLILQRYAVVLSALIERQTAAQKAQLASNDEAQLEALLQQVEKRQQVGDLGELDAELAFLSLTQRLSHTAQAMVELKVANAALRELLPGWSEQRSKFPRGILSNSGSTNSLGANHSSPRRLGSSHSGSSQSRSSQSDSSQFISSQSSSIEQWAEQHPYVRVAKLRWQVSQRDAELVALSTHSDPNVGINVGSSGDENLFALKFSMPLKVRNKNLAELKAAHQQASAAESLYHAAHTQQRIAIETSQAVLNTYRRHQQRWQSLVAGKGEHIRTTLLNRWNNGDLNTTDYLLALQQYFESQWAGIELRRQVDLAQVNWLFQRGRVVTHFNDGSFNDIQEIEK